MTHTKKQTNEYSYNGLAKELSVKNVRNEIHVVDAHRLTSRCALIMYAYFDISTTGPSHMTLRYYRSRACKSSLHSISMDAWKGESGTTR